MEGIPRTTRGCVFDIHPVMNLHLSDDHLHATMMGPYTVLATLGSLGTQIHCILE